MLLSTFQFELSLMYSFMYSSGVVYFLLLLSFSRFLLHVHVCFQPEELYTYVEITT